MDWKSLIMQIAAIALGSNPETRALAPYVGPAVATAEEVLSSKSGAEKLAHATELVKLGISGTNAVRPGTVDEAVSDALIAHSISTVVDAGNLIHKSFAAGGFPAA